jgi:uncharacterized membrane protein YfcA
MSRKRNYFKVKYSLFAGCLYFLSPENWEAIIDPTNIRLHPTMLYLPYLANKKDANPNMLTGIDFLLAGLAAMAAGAVNALAGGGTLITFPMLVALGVPAVSANVTNTVALCPGYLGGTLAQKKDLRGQSKRLWFVLPAAVLGGVLGGFLLLQTGEKLFKELVPYLILLASGLLAIQDPVRAWLMRRMGQGQGSGLEKLSWLPVGLASIYGGYFGAGLSVIVLSALGLTVDDTMTRLNALKQAIAFAVNVAAAIFFIFSGQVVWSLAVVMAVGALIGGTLGGKLAGKIKPSTLRWTVVTIGVIISIVYFIK